jgi:hypothetical protein
VSPLAHGRSRAVAGFQDEEGDAAIGEVCRSGETDGSGTDDGHRQMVELGGHENLLSQLMAGLS